MTGVCVASRPISCEEAGLGADRKADLTVSHDVMKAWVVPKGAG
jgi:hypothetical protein